MSRDTRNKERRANEAEYIEIKQRRGPRRAMSGIGQMAKCSESKPLPSYKAERDADSENHKVGHEIHPMYDFNVTRNQPRSASQTR